MRAPWDWPWPEWAFHETTTWPVAVVMGAVALVLLCWGASLWRDAFRRCGRGFWRDFAHWLGSAMLAESLLYAVLFGSSVRDGERVALWIDALFLAIGVPFVVAFALWLRAERPPEP
jgi:hypothetical protein